MIVAPVKLGSAPARRRPRLIAPNATPSGAMIWGTHAERDKAFANWRRALLHRFDATPRVIKVGICVRDLAGRGYCFAADKWLAEESGVPQAKISDALKVLEDGGAIIRAMVLDGNSRNRRIWLRADFASILSPTAGDTPIPHGGQNLPPAVGGQNKERIRARVTNPVYTRNGASPQAMAALQAEMRERRERGDPMSWDD